MAISAAVTAALWPHAREAWTVLAAQDDPAELSSLRVNSALRNNPGLIHGNIDAALASGDADLAGSFVELARANDIVLSDELSKRVSDAVAADNSTGQFARRFATGFLTGSADDVASLSGTVAGDIFVWGDIRDVVREGKHLTVVATSVMVQRALQAAEVLAKEGIEIEVIDPRTLMPLDDQPIIKSVIKTGKAMVVHEAVKTGGFGGEIVARIMESEAFGYLEAPVRRLAGLDIPIPYNRTLEMNTVPQIENIVDEARKLVKGDY
mgnify:CR=1 FL=1